MVTTQYTHSCFEACQELIPKLKKVVLKNDYDGMSKIKEYRAQVLRTETKVAGRNVIVKSATDFIM
jgi:hypothetical protein